jgi:hypothetical protein
MAMDVSDNVADAAGICFAKHHRRLMPSTRRMTMAFKHVAVASAMWGLIIWASSAEAELGVISPRGSEADIVDLNGDLVTLLLAENRFHRITKEASEVLSQTRQKELLGIDDDGSDYLEAVRNWWRANIFDPAMRIAGNPAAPCKLAQIVLVRLLEAERQAQIKGWSRPGGNLNDPNSLVSQAFEVVKRRCLERAYEACLASGNGQHIILMLAEAIHQFALLNIADVEFEAQAVYLYRRCTVYQLRYHSQSKFDGGWYAIGSDSDGSIILLSDVDPAQGYLGLHQSHEWRGPRPNDPDDALGSPTQCESRQKSTSLVCGLPVPTGTIRGMARIKAGDFSMQRFYDEIEVTLWNDETELEELTRRAKGIPQKPPITSTRKSEGTNALALEFSPWPLTMPVAIRYDPRLPPVSMPFPDSLISYSMAHELDKPENTGRPLTGWTRAGYNVLFEKTFPGYRNHLKIIYADTTRFELLHRPDLFPPDEIVPKWELTSSPEAPAATRKPLRPPAPPR